MIAIRVVPPADDGQPACDAALDLLEGSADVAKQRHDVSTDP